MIVNKQIMKPCALFLIIVTFLMFRTGYGLCDEYDLNDLYRLALKQAERIKVAEEEVNVARSQKDKAFSYLFPRLTTSAEVGSNPEEALMSSVLIKPLFNPGQPHPGRSVSTNPFPRAAGS